MKDTQTYLSAQLYVLKVTKRKEGFFLSKTLEKQYTLELFPWNKAVNTLISSAL